MFRYRAIFCVLGFFFVNSCSNDSECDLGYKKYQVYLYATPEQRFLFFKTDTRRPIDYYTLENHELTQEIDKTYLSHSGKSIGVEASVCGKIEKVDPPPYAYDRSMQIRQAKIVRKIDVTELIARYYVRIQMPVMQEND